MYQQQIQLQDVKMSWNTCIFIQHFLNPAGHFDSMFAFDIVYYVFDSFYEFPEFVYEIVHAITFV